MRKTTLLVLATLAAVTLMPSCVYRLADLTFASTKNVDMNSPDGYVTSTNARVTGKDTAHIIIAFPTGNASPKEAIDQAIEKAGMNCVGLSNAVLYGSFWYIPYVYGQEWYKVEGDPVFKK